MRWRIWCLLRSDTVFVPFGMVLVFLGPSLGFSRHRSNLGPVIPQSTSSNQEVAAKPVDGGGTQGTESPEQMRKTIRRLTSEVSQLRKRVADLERKLQAVSIRGRLIKEEERAGNLQNELLGIGEKILQVQSHIDELNEQLRSENIDRLQVHGSVRPEEVREASRRRLKSDLLRTQTQMELLTRNRARVQTSLAVTELLIQNLRSQLQNSLRP